MFTFVTNETPKVFGIGLSRTGTTSLHHALLSLGYKSYHWGVPEENRMATLEDCYFCDALTDLTASFMFETLYHTFPDAKFIYTTRPLENWLPAIKKHNGLPSPVPLRIRLNRNSVVFNSTVPVAQHRTTLFKAVHHNLYTGHDTWEDAFLAHDKRVKTFFADKPKDKFLEFDVQGAGHGWAELTSFLGRKKPEGVDFPHVSFVHDVVIGG